MKTMKIIDLLNKIANGEDVPKIIQYNDYKFLCEFDKVHDIFYYKNEEGDLLLSMIACTQQLNDTVEIIEEDKQIGKLIVDDTWVGYIDEDRTTKYSSRCVDVTLAKKINELIDKLNELSKKVK